MSLTPENDERHRAIAAFIARIAAAALWQAFWSIRSASLGIGLAGFALQFLGAQAAVAWHLNWKLLIAQIKPARELAESPLFFVASGVVIYLSGGVAPLVNR